MAQEARVAEHMMEYWGVEGEPDEQNAVDRGRKDLEGAVESIRSMKSRKNLRSRST